MPELIKTYTNLSRDCTAKVQLSCSNLRSKTKQKIRNIVFYIRKLKKQIVMSFDVLKRKILEIK